MPAESPKSPQDIEQLKKRHKELEKQKTTAEANLQTASEQLGALKDEARTRYGTDDIQELKKKLEEMKRDNEQKRSTYQAHLEQIEQRLADVEKQFVAGRKSE